MAQYIIEPKKTLKKWVKPFAKIDYLVNFEYVYCRAPDKMYLYKLSTSNSIMAKLILKKYPDKINWRWLSENPSKWAYKLLRTDKINWDLLSKNQSNWAYKLLKNNPDKINWNCLSQNPSKWAYKLLKLDKINWNWLSGNPSNWAYKLLKNNPDKIDWDWLSSNPSRWAYKLLKPCKINWDWLAENTSKWAYKLLKLDKINLYYFSSSSYIFKIIKTNKYYKLFHEKISDLF